MENNNKKNKHLDSKNNQKHDAQSEDKHRESHHKAECGFASHHDKDKSSKKSGGSGGCGC